WRCSSRPTASYITWCGTSWAVSWRSVVARSVPDGSPSCSTRETERELQPLRRRRDLCWCASSTGEAMTEQRGHRDDGGGEPSSGRGFRARKREDHALALIDELKQSLGDLSRARRILLELGRFYDPVLGGAIMELCHQREIVKALEEGRRADAEALIESRYSLYIEHRVHLRGQDQA